MIMQFNDAVNVLPQEDQLFVLAFVRYLKRVTTKGLCRHLKLSFESLTEITDFLLKQGLIRLDHGYWALTDKGHSLFNSPDLNDLEVCDANPEVIRFRDQWAPSVTAAVKNRSELGALVRSFKACVDEFYFSWARQFNWARKLRVLLKRHVCDQLSPEEQKLWDHPLRKRIFEVFQETVGGVRQGWRVDVNERLDFFEYLYERSDIEHDPEFGKLYQNFKDMVFSLGMLRPNTQCHIHISFSFEQRPLKGVIAEYLNMAAITGQYDILLRRYSPYHAMLALNVAPGERVAFDMRGLDFKPITFNLDQRFSLALELPRIPLRNNQYFITCAAVSDKQLELEKQAEIDTLTREMKDIYPTASYLQNIMFGKDGQVYLRSETGEPETVLQRYGINRALYIQKQDQIAIKKAIPTPAKTSGLVLHFFLREPLAVLLEGLDGARPFAVQEIRCLLEILDRYQTEARNEKPNYTGIIDDFFNGPEIGPQDSEMATLLAALDALEAQGQSEAAQYQHIVERLLEGKCKLLTQTLCQRLNTDGFNLVFSLWPLITGKQLRHDSPESSYQTDDAGATLYRFQFMDHLKRELENLLATVFSRYLDISAGTAYHHSEPQLASLIVKQCLNLKADDTQFREELRLSLQRHYQAHFEFLTAYYGRSGASSAELRMALRNQKEIELSIDKDMAQMMACIRDTRERLLSPQNNNRLLRFIDANSLDVQIGLFQYEGEHFNSQQEFLQSHLRHREEIATQQEGERLKIERLKLMLAENQRQTIAVNQFQDAQMKKMKVQHHLEMQRRQSQAQIKQAELDAAVYGTNIELVKKLQDGKLEDAAFLAIIEAMQKGGPAELGKICKDAPEVLAVLKPELFHELRQDEIKQRLMGIFEKNPQSTIAIILATFSIFNGGVADLLAALANSRKMK